jgi:hypothetical protein
LVGDRDLELLNAAASLGVPITVPSALLPLSPLMKMIRVLSS